MEPITAREVLTACQGELLSGDPDVEITGVSTDTRTLQPGDLFFALTGQTSDGHKFLADAFARGASGVVVSRKVETQHLAIRVEDTLLALGALARYYRAKFTPVVIGVTGSVGKTTTKEMIAAVTAPLGLVLKNPGNFNNEIGLPLTLFGLSKEHKTAVLEMAMRGPGQIAYLADIAKPQIGVITNIGLAHIELLGSLDAIADAKAELLEALPEHGAAVLNADDAYFDSFQRRTKASIISFGESPNADVRLTEVSADEYGCCTFEVCTPRGKLKARISVPGEHIVRNALAAIAVGEILQVPHEAIESALTQFQPPEKRCNVTTTKSGVVVIDDTYNASPASVLSALRTLRMMQGGRKVAVLGDMLELGGAAHDAHLNVGRAVNELGLDVLIAVGNLAKLISQGAADSGFPPQHIYEFENSQQAAAHLPGFVHLGDVVLVKGSRAMKMERIVEALLGT
ncbi:MAG: UDP-N-acetylmuramoyl-tripeptide--D-alanyl-D-alanine ligase [Armatimonadota bacterium]|nr:UDP-N-acetylmuramoyl-tripeptide--D-alanyl-D-alanine ligase [Armatimonadota bacterium]